MAEVNYENNALFRIFWDGCNEVEVDNGRVRVRPTLRPVEAPTGIGKTTAMIAVIVELIKRDPTKRIFIVSTRRNNLDDVGKALKADPVITEDMVLRLKSMQHTDHEFLNAVQREEIKVPQEIRDLRQYKEFESGARAMLDYKEPEENEAVYDKAANKRSLKAYQDWLIERHRNDKRELTKKITEILDERIAAIKRVKNASEDERQPVITKADRIAYIQSKSAEWGFLYYLYPSMCIPQANVVLMTTTRLMLPLSSPTQRYRQHLYEAFYGRDQGFADSIIFLDESDDDFREMRKVILEHAAKGCDDLIRLFYDVRNSKQRNRDRLLDACCDGTEERQRIQLQFKRVYRRAGQLTHRYHLDRPLKTDKSAQNQYDTLFMFKTTDASYYENGRELHVHYNDNKNKDDRREVNTIYVPQKGQDGKDPAILWLTTDVFEFIRGSVMGLIYDLANGYLYQKEHADAGMDHHRAMRTVMDLLGFSPASIEFILDNLYEQRPTKESWAKAKVDPGFYQNGITAAALSDNTAHNETTKICHYACSLTPEQIVANLAEQSCVWLLSATALNESVIANFNLVWLRSFLAGKYRPLTSQQLDDLNAWIDQVGGYYENGDPSRPKVKYAIRDMPSYKDKRGFSLKVVRQLFTVRDDSTESAARNKSAERLYHRMVSYTRQGGTDSSDPTFVQLRYLNLFRAYQYYLVQDVESCLVFGNKAVDDSAAFNKEFITECLGILDEYYHVPENRRGFYVLRTDTLEEDKERVDEAFLAGRSCFVYTIYQANGVGQNLQHCYIPNDRYVRLNDRPDEGRMDYDMIYLMNPTHVIEQIDYNETETLTEQRLRYIYMVESLRDPMSRELDDAKARELLHGMVNGRGWNRDIQISDTRSGRMAKARILIQALGRIGRTSVRARKVHILIDDDALPALRGMTTKGHAYGHELKQALNSSMLRCTADGMDNAVAEEDPFVSEMRCQNAYAYLIIQRLLARRDGRFLHMKEWETLRREILRPITTDAEYEALSPYTQAMYVRCEGLELDSYYYRTTDDYKNVEISLDAPIPGGVQASAANARLLDVLRVPGVLEYCRAQSYRTDMHQSLYIMVPVAYNNILKGAIGELGAHIINRDAGYWNVDIHLRDIEDDRIFEDFDSVVDGKPIYIDFKNLSEYSTMTDEDVLKARWGGIDKARKCGAKAIIYIQPTTRQEYRMTDIYSDVVDGVRVVELPGLYVVRGGVAVRNSAMFDKLYEVCHEI